MKSCDVCETKLKNKDPALNIDYAPGDDVPGDMKEEGSTVCQPCARLAIAQAVLAARIARKGTLHG